MMKTEKLFKLLTLVGGVRSTKWETVMQLVDTIKQGGVSIIDKRWVDSWREYDQLDLSDINTWSTYDDTCIDLQFSNDTGKDNGFPNNQLVCKVKIYDGRSLDGARTGLKFEAKLWLPTSFIHNIEQRIGWGFDSYLEDAYEIHLKSQKNLWINNMKNEILK